MDKDRIKGKMKDIAGRAQRQAGEWTGSEEQQVKGTMKQGEGKVQNVIGKVKDASRDAADDAKRDLENRDQRPPKQRRVA